MSDIEFNLLDPDRLTDAFTDLMVSCRNISFVNKFTRISTAMILIYNTRTNNLKQPVNSAVATDLIFNHFAVYNAPSFFTKLLPIQINCKDA